METKQVQCSIHGLTKPAFVCQHLNKKTKVGFFEPENINLENIDPFEEYQAWCEQCEKIRAIEGEWNDKSEGFAKPYLICSNCFLEIKNFNLG